MHSAGIMVLFLPERNFGGLCMNTPDRIDEILMAWAQNASNQMQMRNGNITNFRIASWCVVGSAASAALFVFFLFLLANLPIASAAGVVAALMLGWMCLQSVIACEELARREKRFLHSTRAVANEDAIRRKIVRIIALPLAAMGSAYGAVFIFVSAIPGRFSFEGIAVGTLAVSMFSLFAASEYFRACTPIPPGNILVPATTK